MDEKERSRALDLALSQIEKQFGKGSILRLGSKDAIVPVSVISTGSISLDAALGVGGFPRGRINEIFGPESSGKTTIALQVVARLGRIDMQRLMEVVVAQLLAQLAVLGAQRGRFVGHGADGAQAQHQGEAQPRQQGERDIHA